MSNFTTPPAPPPPGDYGGFGGYGSQDYGQTPTGELASWPVRFGGFVIDYLLYLPGFILYYLGAPKVSAVTVNGASTLTQGGGVLALEALGFLWILGVAIYNRWIRGGAGQSIGKKVVGLRLLGEQTGQPIGPGMAFVRDVAHVVDSIICYIGWLFPLWDAKKQTLADKIVKTVVVRA